MADFVKKYQRWLSEFNHTLHEAQQQQLNNMVDFVSELKAYVKAGKELSAYETQRFIETFKRQWHEYVETQDQQPDDDIPSLWPEALWQELSNITDKSQLEWQELAQDFRHKGVYFQGEMVGMGRYRCEKCLTHIDYTHPAPLLACSHCGGVQFFREGLPV